MQTKQFSIRLDMQQALPFHPFEVIEGDTGNVVEITLLNSGEALLLNDCAIVVAFTSSMGFAMQDATSGVTIGEAAGTFTLVLDPASYGPGNVSVDVQVYSGPGNRVLITSTRFDFRCRRALISEEIIRANAAYPPLISATQDATDAAAEARAAVASIEGRLGEVNVQSDWTETDDGSDAFIQHKPRYFEPTAHAAIHSTIGDDPVTPASIGALATTAVPSDIGAVAASTLGAASGVATLDAGAKVTAAQAASDIVTLTESATMNAAGAGKLYLMDGASAIVVTLPADATAEIPVGAEYEFVRYNTGAVTFAAETDATLLSVNALTGVASQYGCAAVKKLAANTWLLAGDLG